MTGNSASWPVRSRFGLDDVTEHVVNAPADAVYYLQIHVCTPSSEKNSVVSALHHDDAMIVMGTSRHEATHTSSAGSYCARPRLFDKRVVQFQPESSQGEAAGHLQARVLVVQTEQGHSSRRRRGCIYSSDVSIHEDSGSGQAKSHGQSPCKEASRLPESLPNVRDVCSMQLFLCRRCMLLPSHTDARVLNAFPLRIKYQLPKATTADDNGEATPQYPTQDDDKETKEAASLSLPDIVIDRATVSGGLVEVYFASPAHHRKALGMVAGVRAIMNDAVAIVSLPDECDIKCVACKSKTHTVAACDVTSKQLAYVLFLVLYDIQLISPLCAEWTWQSQEWMTMCWTKQLLLPKSPPWPKSPSCLSAV